MTALESKVLDLLNHRGAGNLKMAQAVIECVKMECVRAVERADTYTSYASHLHQSGETPSTSLTLRFMLNGSKTIKESIKAIEAVK